MGNAYSEQRAIERLARRVVDLPIGAARVAVDSHNPAIPPGVTAVPQTSAQLITGPAGVDAMDIGSPEPYSDMEDTGVYHGDSMDIEYPDSDCDVELMNVKYEDIMED